MSFKKLLLASAIAAVSTSSFAMEAMDDSSMSDTTGQDGLSITLATKLSLDMYIHDTNGFTGYTDSGAIVLTGIAVDDNAAGNAGFKIDIDAGATSAAATAPILQVSVSTTTATKFTLGALKVANSNRATSWGLVASSTTGTLMNLGSLVMAATTNLLNIQMGNESATQAAWMRINTTFTGGLAITGFTINDAGGAISGGGIGFDLTVKDSGAGADLGADIKVDANTAGLQLTLTKIGVAGSGAGTGMDVRMANLKLGDVAGATKVGDIEIIGLNLNGTTVTVAGH